MRFERKLSRHREKYNISRNKRPPSWGKCSVHSSSCRLPAPHPVLTVCCLLHTPFSLSAACSTPLSHCLLPAAHPYLTVLPAAHPYLTVLPAPHPFLTVCCVLHTPFSLSQSLLTFSLSLSPHSSFCLSLSATVGVSVCLPV